MTNITQYYTVEGEPLGSVCSLSTRDLQATQHPQRHGMNFCNTYRPYNLLTMAQADAKTAPTNPMKELRIDKLVISAFFGLFIGSDLYAKLFTNLHFHRHLSGRVG